MARSPYWLSNAQLGRSRFGQASETESRAAVRTLQQQAAITVVLGDQRTGQGLGAQCDLQNAVSAAIAYVRGREDAAAISREGKLQHPAGGEREVRTLDQHLIPNVDAGSGAVSNAGAMVLFRRGSDGVWRHEASLRADQPVGASEFGSRVAVDDGVLLVGAPNDQVSGLRAGGAYLFQQSGPSWAQRRVLRNSDAGEIADFGWSVALQDGVAVVGCANCFVFPGGPSNTGSFFTFERNLGGVDNWALEGESVGSRPGFIDNFSISLRLSCALLLVGATGTNPNVASVFARGEGGWQEVDFLESGETLNTEYGQSLALAVGRAFVGASLWPNTSSSERWGAVYSWYSQTLVACEGQIDRLFCDGFEDLP